MIAPTLAMLVLGSYSSILKTDDYPVGTTVQAGATVTWNGQGVTLTSLGVERWQCKEHLQYRPDYLDKLKAFVMVTDSSEGKFHITVVERSGRVLSQLEVEGGQSGIPAVIPCGETLAMADPGVFARAPILGESNPSWLDARQQLNVLSFSISNGAIRWQAPELNLGQPLAASGSYLWTIRLTNPSRAYAGARPTYEIEQVGVYSGKIVRTWPYPDSGIDLAAYRWKAEIRGSTCLLHRLEPWPDSNTIDNTSPTELSLAKIVTTAKSKKKPKKKPQ